MTTTSALDTSHIGRTVDAATVLAWHKAAESDGAGAPMVVDVRSAAEYVASHIRGSYHVPLATLAAHTLSLIHI